MIKDDRSKAELENLKASLAEIEEELRWLKRLLVATLGFTACLIWHYGSV